MALPPAVILCPMGLLWGGLTSHKHKQAKDADSQQEAERRNTTTAKALTAETYTQLYLLYAFGRRVYLKWFTLHSSFNSSCIP